MDVFKEKCNDLDTMNDIEKLTSTPNKQPLFEGDTHQESPEKTLLKSLEKEIHDRMNNHIIETRVGLHSFEKQQNDFYDTAKNVSKSAFLELGPEIPNDPTVAPVREIIEEIKSKIERLISNSQDSNKDKAEEFTNNYKKIAYLSDAFFKNTENRDETFALIKEGYKDINAWLKLELENCGKKRASLVGAVTWAADEVGSINRNAFNEVVKNRDVTLMNKWEDTQAYVLLYKIRQESEDLDRKGRIIKNYGTNMQDDFSDETKIIVSRMEEYFNLGREKSE